MTPLSIPNIPTDNLYKFYALSGMIATLFLVVTISLMTIRMREEVQTLEAETDIIEVESEFLIQDLNTITSRQEKLSKSLAGYNLSKDSILDKALNFNKTISDMRSDSEYRNYLEFVFKYQEHVVPEIREYQELQKLNLESKRTNRKLTLKTTELKSKTKQLRSKLDELLTMFIVGVAGIIYLINFSFKGFRLWKENVQEPIDRKIKIELELLEYERERKFDSKQT